jgi:ATP synthase protein I
MTDHSPEPRDLQTFGKRLDEVRAREVPKAKGSSAPTSLGIAFRFSSELVSALIVGFVLGWVLDWIFGTHFLRIVFVCIGAVAGIRNVMRAAKELNAGIETAPQTPSVPDDEES